MRFIFLPYDVFYLNDVFYSAMCFIFIYLRLYLFKALFIQLKLYSYPFQSFPNRFYPLISNSKNFKQTLSIACL